MKKKFVVHASYVNYVKAEIEADNIEEAKELAYNMDGGDFDETGFADWNIDDVVAVR